MLSNILNKLSINRNEIRDLLKSRDYLINTDLDLEEIEKRINSNTLYKTTLTNAKTSKKFIGYLLNKKIKIIDSSKIGFFCIVNGVLEMDKNCRLRIKTKTHSAFIVLYALWLIGMIILFSMEYLKENKFDKGLMGVFALLIPLALIFRLYIHVLYLLSKKRVLKNLNLILS